MDLKQCGRTGLYLSAIGIGTLTWGRDTDGPEALDMLRRFVDAGGNLVECSASHGDGIAVDILSEAMSAVGRHRVAVAWRGGVRRASEGAWVSAVSMMPSHGWTQTTWTCGWSNRARRFP